MKLDKVLKFYYQCEIPKYINYIASKSLLKTYSDYSDLKAHYYSDCSSYFYYLYYGPYSDLTSDETSLNPWDIFSDYSSHEFYIYWAEYYNNYCFDNFYNSYSYINYYNWYYYYWWNWYFQYCRFCSYYIEYYYYSSYYYDWLYWAYYCYYFLNYNDWYYTSYSSYFSYSTYSTYSTYYVSYYYLLNSYSDTSSSSSIGFDPPDFINKNTYSSQNELAYESLIWGWDSDYKRILENCFLIQNSFFNSFGMRFGTLSDGLSDTDFLTYITDQYILSAVSNEPFQFAFHRIDITSLEHDNDIEDVVAYDAILRTYSGLSPFTQTNMLNERQFKKAFYTSFLINMIIYTNPNDIMIETMLEARPLFTNNYNEITNNGKKIPSIGYISGNFSQFQNIEKIRIFFGFLEIMTVDSFSNAVSCQSNTLINITCQTYSSSNQFDVHYYEREEVIYLAGSGNPRVSNYMDIFTNNQNLSNFSIFFPFKIPSLNQNNYGVFNLLNPSSGFGFPSINFTSEWALNHMWKLNLYLDFNLYSQSNTLVASLGPGQNFVVPFNLQKFDSIYKNNKRYFPIIKMIDYHSILSGINNTAYNIFYIENKERKQVGEISTLNVKTQGLTYGSIEDFSSSDIYDFLSFIMCGNWNFAESSEFSVHSNIEIANFESNCVKNINYVYKGENDKYRSCIVCSFIQSIEFETLFFNNFAYPTKRGDSWPNAFYMATDFRGSIIEVIQHKLGQQQLIPLPINFYFTHQIFGYEIVSQTLIFAIHPTHQIPVGARIELISTENFFPFIFYQSRVFCQILNNYSIVFFQDNKVIIETQIQIPPLIDTLIYLYGLDGYSAASKNSSVYNFYVNVIESQTKKIMMSTLSNLENSEQYQNLSFTHFSLPPYSVKINMIRTTNVLNAPCILKIFINTYNFIYFNGITVKVHLGSGAYDQNKNQQTICQITDENNLMLQQFQACNTTNLQTITFHYNSNQSISISNVVLNLFNYYVQNGENNSLFVEIFNRDALMMSSNAIFFDSATTGIPFYNKITVNRYPNVQGIPNEYEFIITPSIQHAKNDVLLINFPYEYEQVLNINVIGCYIYSSFSYVPIYCALSNIQKQLQITNFLTNLRQGVPLNIRIISVITPTFLSSSSVYYAAFQSSDKNKATENGFAAAQQPSLLSPLFSYIIQITDKKTTNHFIREFTDIYFDFTLSQLIQVGSQILVYINYLYLASYNMIGFSCTLGQVGELNFIGEGCNFYGDRFSIQITQDLYQDIKYYVLLQNVANPLFTIYSPPEIQVIIVDNEMKNLIGISSQFETFESSPDFIYDSAKNYLEYQEYSYTIPRGVYSVITATTDKNKFQDNVVFRIDSNYALIIDCKPIPQLGIFTFDAYIGQKEMKFAIAPNKNNDRTAIPLQIYHINGNFLQYIPLPMILLHVIDVQYELNVLGCNEIQVMDESTYSECQKYPP